MRILEFLNVSFIFVLELCPNAFLFFLVFGFTGSRPQKLSRVALVVGEALEREGGSLTSSWDDLFLSLGYAIRWFDCRGVESVILYDLQGVLKSQWGTKELKRALEKGEGGGEGKTACTIKILSKEDWENAVTQFVSEKSAGGMRLGKWIETFAVTKLENGCGGVGVTPLGDAPQLILVFSEDNLFSLCGFFPWLTKSAEIYKISKGTLENDLCVALKNFYNTKMRFGS